MTSRLQPRDPQWRGEGVLSVVCDQGRASAGLESTREATGGTLSRALSVTLLMSNGSSGVRIFSCSFKEESNHKFREALDKSPKRSE